MQPHLFRRNFAPETSQGIFNAARFSGINLHGMEILVLAVFIGRGRHIGVKYLK